MFAKKFSKQENLPILKPSSYTLRHKDRILSLGGSPSKTEASLMDINEAEKSVHVGGHTMNVFNFSSMQLRSTSLANQQLDKKTITFLSPEHSPPNSQVLGYMKREENKKKIDVWEKLTKLKHSLSKYNDPNEQVLIPTKSDIKKIIICLELLTDVDSNLTGLMELVVKVLRTALFVNPLAVEPFEERLYQEGGPELKNMIQGCQNENMPYPYLCMTLMKELAFNPKREQELEIKNFEIDKLHQMLEHSQTLVKDLDRQLKERISPKEHQELMVEMSTLRENYGEISKNHEGLVAKHSDMTEDNLALKRQIDSDVTEIEKHILQIQMLERARERVIKETEDSRKQVMAMKLKIMGFKDTMDKIIVKLGNIKQQVYDMRQQNEDLTYRNQKLSLRAALGFEALTPRPDYKKLQEEKKLDLPIFDATGRRQMLSTIKVLDELISKTHQPEDNPRDSVFRKSERNMLSKVFAANAVKSSAKNLTPQPPKSRTSVLDGTHKSFFAKEAAPSQGNISPRNATTLGKIGDASQNISPKDGVPSVQNFVTEGDDDKVASSLAGIPIMHSKSDLGRIIGKSERKVRDRESFDNGFGAETIQEANELIDHVVATKKTIDKFE